MNTLSFDTMQDIYGGNFWDVMDWVCVGVEAAGIGLEIAAAVNSWNAIGWIAGGAQIVCGGYQIGRALNGMKGE